MPSNPRSRLSAAALFMSEGERGARPCVCKQFTPDCANVSENTGQFTVTGPHLCLGDYSLRLFSLDKCLVKQSHLMIIVHKYRIGAYYGRYSRTTRETRKKNHKLTNSAVDLSCLNNCSAYDKYRKIWKRFFFRGELHGLSSCLLFRLVRQQWLDCFRKTVPLTTALWCSENYTYYLK